MKRRQLSGEIEKFQGYGRKLGYPTANIRCDTLQKDGVYFGYADLGEFRSHPALIFVGTPTTVGDVVRRVEAHLLDIPDKDYYGKILHLDLDYFHRKNETFETIAELKEAMHDDEKQARAWFKSQTFYS